VILQRTAISLSTALAGVIGMLGLLGLSAHSAAQRTKEIGIRKAMGASRLDILRFFVLQFARPVLWANLYCVAMRVLPHEALARRIWASRQFEPFNVSCCGSSSTSCRVGDSPGARADGRARQAGSMRCATNKRQLREHTSELTANFPPRRLRMS